MRGHPTKMRAFAAKRRTFDSQIEKACTIRARCFLSLRSDRVIRVFNAHQAVANASFRRTPTM